MDFDAFIHAFRGLYVSGSATNLVRHYQYLQMQPHSRPNHHLLCNSIAVTILAPVWPFHIKNLLHLRPSE